jgi:hypothetical protein
MDVDDLKSEMDRRFEQVDARFEQIDARFERVEERFTAISQQIADEGRVTRRHFDIVFEQMKAERNLALDQSAAVMEQLRQLRADNDRDHRSFERRLDDHEFRLNRLENP